MNAMKPAFSHLAIVALLAVAPRVPAADSTARPVPLGSRGIFPTSERPIGWRGDGSGAWPGATPVAEWNAETGQNVVWKTPMPGPSFSQPIVVGDKVFTLADPNWLICLSAADGRVLWQKAGSHNGDAAGDGGAGARGDRFLGTRIPQLRDLARCEEALCAEVPAGRDRPRDAGGE